MAKISVIPLVRAFAKDEAALETVIERAHETVKVLRKSGAPFMAFLVPRDHDKVGKTFARLRDAFLGDTFVQVLTVPEHHSCGALNHGVHVLACMNVTHALILSGKAVHFLTPEVYQDVVRRHEEGAYVVGAAVGDLADIVREGIPQNTFCSWEIEYLQSVDGFVNEMGVEEIDPLVAMCRNSTHPFISIIDGLEGDLKIRNDPEAKRRHQDVMDTKLTRQGSVLGRLAFCRSCFQGYIIKS